MGAALQAEAAELRAAIQSEEDELQALCAQARPRLRPRIPYPALVLQAEAGIR